MAASSFSGPRILPAGLSSMARTRADMAGHIARSKPLRDLRRSACESATPEPVDDDGERLDARAVGGEEELGRAALAVRGDVHEAVGRLGQRAGGFGGDAESLAARLQRGRRGFEERDVDAELVGELVEAGGVGRR